jgi:diacylglycerol kinase family enzyme
MAVRTFLTQYVVRPPRVAIEAGGQTLHGITAVVQNGDPFTYFNLRPIHLAENVSADSGDLAGAMLHRATPLAVPGVAARLLSRRLRAGDSRAISLFDRARVVRAYSADGRPVPLELDGDWIGDTTDVEFSVRPRALTVVA